jgi:RimJ/RimL family protein N-acetyltransferase
VDHLSCNLFVIIRLAEDKSYPIGFVYDYDYNPEDGYTYIASAMLESHMRQGLGAEASFVFLDWLFNTYPLRKVYSDIYGYNRLSLSTTMSGGFKEEGRLLQHRYWPSMHIGT